MGANFITGSLAALCALLGILIVLPTSPVDHANNRAGNAGLSQQDTLDFEQLLIDEKRVYPSIGERPLFNPERKPFVELVESVPDVTEPSPVIAVPAKQKVVPPKLAGIMRIAGKLTAFVLKPGDITPVPVRVGDQFDDWSVSAMTTEQAVLEREDQTETLVIEWQENSSNPVLAPWEQEQYNQDAFSYQQRQQEGLLDPYQREQQEQAMREYRQLQDQLGRQMSADYYQTDQ